MATSYYSTGTVSLTNGSPGVTGVGTLWQAALITNGVIFVQGEGNPLPILSVTGEGAITAELAWTGPTGSYSYAILRQTEQMLDNAENSKALAYIISEIRNGTIFKYDASGDLAGRALYNERPKGFSYLVLAGNSAQLYVKSSNTSGAWSGPFAYGAGPVGPAPTLTIGTTTTREPGQPATASISGSGGSYSLSFGIPAGLTGINQRGAYASGTTYAERDAVLHNGSTWLAKQATTGNAPPGLPTTENDYWILVAAKGLDGNGSGDMTAGTYDPQNKQADAFDGANLHEGSVGQDKLSFSLIRRLGAWTLDAFNSGAGLGNEAADSASLTSALSSGERTILIPEKTFLIAADEYSIMDGVTLVGRSSQASVLHVQDESYSGGGVLAIEAGKSNISLSDFAVRGPFDVDDERYVLGSSAIWLNGTKDSRCDNIRFDGLEISGWGDNAIHGYFLTNSKAERNYIHHIGRAGLLWLSSDVDSLRNRIEHIRPGGGGREPTRNAYGIAYTMSKSESSVYSSGECAYNVIRGIPTWEGLDTHAGSDVDFHDNIVEGTMSGLVLTSIGSGGSYTGNPRRNKANRNTISRANITRKTPNPRNLQASGWSSFGATVAPNATGPNSDTLAFSLIEDTSTSHSLRGDMAVTGGQPYVFQAFVARGVGSRDLNLRVSTSTTTFLAAIDLSDGSIIGQSAVGGSGILDWVKVRATDEGFYHVRMKVTPDVSETASARIYMAQGDSISYAGDGSSSIRVFFPEGFDWDVYSGPYARSGIYCQMYAAGVTSGGPEDIAINGNYISGYGANDHDDTIEGAISIGSVLGLQCNDNVIVSSNGVGLHLFDSGLIIGSSTNNRIQVVLTVNGINDYLRSTATQARLIFDDNTFYRKGGNAVGVNITTAPNGSADGLVFGAQNHFIGFTAGNATQLPFASTAAARLNPISPIFAQPVASVRVNSVTGAVDSGFGATSSKTGTGVYSVTLSSLFRASAPTAYRGLVTINNSRTEYAISWSGDTATVTTYNTSGTAADATFHLVVFASG